MKEPWNVERQWRVSPANYDPAVTSQYHFPSKIEILDTTLRDGEQQPALFIAPPDRIRLVQQMAAIGIHCIEAGTPAISSRDADAVKSITALHLGPKIFAFCRAMPTDVKLAKECGVDGVIIEIPSSEHLLKYGKRWTPEKAIQAAIEGTLAAKEEGLYVTFFPADSSRAEIEYLLDLIDQVRSRGHMDSVVLVDTFGCYTPTAAAYTVRRIKDRFGKLPVEVHFHEDFGMGVANTIAGLSAGAEVAHTTINGVGERAGSVPYEPLVLSLRILYGIDVGIKLDKIVETSKMMRAITGQDVHPHKAVVGDRIFTYETGLPWSLWVNCREENPTAMFSYMWYVTGHSGPEIVIGKKSGKDNIIDYLKKLNLEANPDQVTRILEMVKGKAYKVNRVLNEKEFMQIYRRVMNKG
ncbi:MAG: LeuA family protein [Thermodesulfobacteriota bacterium]